MIVKDKKISFWEKKTVTTETGRDKTVYEKTFSNVWAYYKNISGDRNYQMLNGLWLADDNERALFIINYRKAITTAFYIEYNNFIYEIKSLNNGEGYEKDLKITAEKTTLSFHKTA